MTFVSVCSIPKSRGIPTKLQARNRELTDLGISRSDIPFVPRKAA
jgi:uncharacterized protein YjiS (DUF1127 family)